MQEQIAKLKSSLAAMIRKCEDQQLEIQRLKSSPAQYKKRPSTLSGKTFSKMVGCGKLWITINYDDFGCPFEIFFKLGKNGACQQSYLDAISLAISVGLRSGVPLEKFAEKFRGIRCPRPRMRDAENSTTLSCADAIGQALAEVLGVIVAEEDPHKEAVVSPVVEVYSSGGGLCPDCGSMIIYQGGCEQCASNCGYTGKCG